MGPSLQVIDEIQYKLGDVKDSMLKEGHLRIASTHMNSVTIVSIDSKVYKYTYIYILQLTINRII